MRMNKALFKARINPNECNVKYIASVFDVCFYKTENELIQLFQKELSKENIENRVRKLNAYYHTRLSGEVINEIVKKLEDNINDLNSRILNSDDNTVDEIASCDFGYYFVFATKYCSFVNPDSYPICDNIVYNLLRTYQNRDRFYNDTFPKFESLKSQHNYKLYKKIIKEFQSFYHLEKCSYREIDKYLWIIGKNN